MLKRNHKGITVDIMLEQPEHKKELKQYIFSAEDLFKALW